jgi:O-antigen ligase
MAIEIKPTKDYFNQMKQESLANNLALRLTFYSLVILTIGVFTSTTLFGLHHILLLFPCAYFFTKELKKGTTLSHYSLFALCLTMIITVLVNWDIILSVKDSFGLAKYYFMGALAIFPYREAFKKYIDFKKKKLLLNLFLFSTTLASLSGLIAAKTDFNYISWSINSFPGRASGLVGGILGHSYGISLFLIILSGMILNRDKIKNYISTKWLLIYWIINFSNLYFSFSRGAWLGYLLAVPFLFWFRSKRIFLLIFILSLTFLGLSIKFNSMAKERFLNSYTSNDQRITYFKTALYGFLERPFRGWGINNFGKYVIPLKKKYGLKYQDQPGKVHNNFTDFLSTTGIFGVIVFAQFLFFWAKEGIKNGDFGETNFAFIISVIVSGMFYDTLHEKYNIIFILSVYGIYIALKAKEEGYINIPYLNPSYPIAGTEEGSKC